MKILICSDSHGDYFSLNDIVLKNYDCDYFFHLGDSGLPSYLLNNFCGVKGNCDFNDLPKTRDIEIEGLKFHLEHGDSIKFMYNPTKYVESLDCDIFVFGHTHKKLFDKLESGKYLINPGTLTRPRDGDKGSYLIIKIENKKIVSYKFIEVTL